MGSFNLKCALSQSVIQPNERCLVIPLVQSFNRFNYQTLICESGHPTEARVYVPYGPITTPFNQWEPLTLPLTGTFEDCFLVELDKTNINSSRLLRLIAKLIATASTVSTPHTQKGAFKVSDVVESIYPELQGLLQELMVSTSMAQEQTILQKIEFSKLFEVWHQIVVAMGDDLVILAPNNAFVQLAVISLSAKDALITGMAAIRPNLYAQLWARKKNAIAHELKICAQLQTNAANKKKPSNLNAPFLKLGIESVFESSISSLCLSPIWFPDDYPEWAKQVSMQDTEALTQGISLSLIDDLFFLECLLEANYPLNPSLYAGQDYSNDFGELMASIIKAANEKQDCEE